MTYNTKVFNYSNLTEEDKQIVVAQLLMLDSIENVITEGQKKNLFPPLGCDNLYTKFYLRCSIY